MIYRDEFRPYVSVGEKAEKAKKKIASLKKKSPGIKPVVIEGRTLAHSWWGKAWNKNLESYADYSNRIGRGRSYVKNSAVIDLQIEPGLVTSMVMGSQSAPYNVQIEIKKLNKKKWNHVNEICKNELDSLQELLEGKFPESLKKVFKDKAAGIFPSPSEISFECSCPDWADMCKHVAAALYGVGARLDIDPSLFFTLRKVDMNDLLTKAIGDKTETLLRKAEQKSSRVIDDNDIVSIFGIDMEDSGIPNQSDLKKAGGTIKPKNKTAKKKSVKKKAIKKKAAAKKKVTRKKKVSYTK